MAGDPQKALRLTYALCFVWDFRGVRHEAIAALERSLKHPRGIEPSATHFNVLWGLAVLLALTGNYTAARIHFELLVPLARERGDIGRYAGMLERLGWVAREQGDSATAWLHMTESLAILRELGDAAAIAGTLMSMAQIAVLDEDSERAELLLAESRVLGQHVAVDSDLSICTLNHLGHAAQLRGDYGRAAQLHHESLTYMKSHHHASLVWAYHGLGETALGLGNSDEAARWLAQGLALSQTLYVPAYIAWCLAGLGSAAALDEESERAARLWGAAEGLRQSIGCRSAPAARATYERAMAVARAQLGDEAFAAAWAAGQALPLKQALAEALDEAA